MRKHQFHSHKRIKSLCKAWRASQAALVVNNTSANAGDVRDAGAIPGSGRSPGGGHGNPLQYSCRENPMDRGAWQATVHRVEKSQTQRKWLSKHTGKAWSWLDLRSKKKNKQKTTKDSLGQSETTQYGLCVNWFDQCSSNPFPLLDYEPKTMKKLIVEVQFTCSWDRHAEVFRGKVPWFCIVFSMILGKRNLWKSWNIWGKI